MKHMDNSKFIIITTIHKPTKAIEKFAQWKHWHVVVVGDKKTPTDWCCDGVTYLSLKEQYSQSFLEPLAKAIPENTYIRKMLGYIYAIQHGATAIFETDDDNIPYDDAEDVLNGVLDNKSNHSQERVRSDLGWVNIYERFGAQDCWPRGFPIEMVKSTGIHAKKGNDTAPWKVMQFLADGDPDVDAIFRMLKSETICFDKEKMFLLDEGTFCPFNSQATLWLPETFPLLFFPLGVTDRTADILRGYIALACLWKMNCTLGYSSPVVFQERNIHNLLDDFAKEVPLYLNADKWAYLMKSVTGNDAADCYFSALSQLRDEKILGTECLDLYGNFLSSAGIS